MRKPKNDGKKQIGIVGSVVNGRSGDGGFGPYTGCDTIKQQIGRAGDIEVYINSPGGSVFAGFEILNALTAAITAGRKVDIYISAMAASIASYISTGVVGANVYAAQNSKLMYHAPWSCAYGSKSEMRDMADLLEKIENDLKDAIESRGVEFEDEWFAAARMKWFDAKEALDAKLIDGIKLPPSDLINAVSEQTPGSVWDDDDEWNKANDKSKNEQFDFDRNHFTKIAADIEFIGFVESLCKEHFGDDKIKNVVNMTANSFEIIFNNGETLLLNYEKDAVNIVNIKWEPDGSQQTLEKTMSTPNTKTPEEIAAEAEAKVKATQAALEAAEAKAKEAEAKAAEAEAKMKDAEAISTEAEAKATAIVAKAKAESVAIIMENKENTFTDEELTALDLEIVEKIANLAKPVATQKTKSDSADNSIVSPPSSDAGETGTLPPPKF